MSDAPNILIIRRRYLGDIVLLGPVFRSLRTHWPKVRITAMVDRAYAPVLTLNPDVDHTIFVPNNLIGWCRTFRHLQKSRFTHALDLDNRSRTALVSRLSRAGHRITLHHGANVQCPSCYTHSEIAESDFFANRHITDYYALSLRPLNITPDPSAPELKPLASDFVFVKQLPEFASLPANSSRVFIHPGSRSPHRIWPAERFAEVITRLIGRNITPVIVAGPGEKTVVNEIQAKLPQPAIAISRPLSIPQLAALFATGDVVLCHDSGPMHLAAAVGTKVVALFSSQNVATWKPLGEGHLTLQAPMPCNPCLSPGFCKPEDSYFNHCVQHLSVDQVFAAVLQQLRSKQS
jgi:ADP-heptose:LPS heptosyltransferase